MGSGFKTFSAATKAQAADINGYLMKQSIAYFASTSARDSAITAPERGMTCYIGSNDASEGLYTYNGTTWRKGSSWNAAWGQLIGEASSTSAVTTSGTTEKILKTSSSFTAVANRNYLVMVTATISADAGTDVYTLRTRVDSVTGTILSATQDTIAAANGPQPVTLSSVVTLSAGARTINLTMQRASGTGSGTNQNGYAVYFTVVDIGPSGAPS